MKQKPLAAIAFSLAVLLFHVPKVHAQHPAAKDPPARPADVGTLEGLMGAFYEVVNVAPDEARQWDRDRTLYVPWIRFVGTSIDSTGKAKTSVWTHPQYVEATEPLVRSGFKEWEISRRTKQYGNIAHIDSIYAGEATEQGKIERFRGVNSIEAYFDGARWWISSVMWMSESPNHPIPREYLEKK